MCQRHVHVNSLNMTKREIFTWHYLILALNDLYSVEILWNKFLEKSASDYAPESEPVSSRVIIHTLGV
jgi:hypothetical protein